MCGQVVCGQVVCGQVVCRQLCGDKLRVDKQVVCRQLCVDKLCVGKSERRRGGEAELQNQKQEPHTKMWGTITTYHNNSHLPVFMNAKQAVRFSTTHYFALN